MPSLFLCLIARPVSLTESAVATASLSRSRTREPVCGRIRPERTGFGRLAPARVSKGYAWSILVNRSSTFPLSWSPCWRCSCIVHAVRVWLLSDELDRILVWTFAFVPARYDASALTDGLLPGGWGAEIWTFFTYALIHADLTHLGVNAIWLLAFASPVARRFGPWRFLAFFMLTIAAGALAHLVTHAGELAPTIGASAGVSGTMAAAARFAFERGGPLDFRHGDRDDGGPGAGGAAPCCTAQSARRDLSRGLVRPQSAVRAGLLEFHRGEPERGLGGPCRRLSRRPAAVFGLRSGRTAVAPRASTRCTEAR